jgi:hypothetical protein
MFKELVAHRIRRFQRIPRLRERGLRIAKPL